jgi:hypothetical protein
VMASSSPAAAEATNEAQEGAAHRGEHRAVAGAVGEGRAGVGLPRLRRADTYLPDNFVTPFSYHFAQCAGSINLPARYDRLPGNARTILGNDSITNHPEVARLEFGCELSGSHGPRLRSRAPRRLCKTEHKARCGDRGASEATLRDDSQGRLGKPDIRVRERSSYLRILRRSDIDSRPEPDIVQRPSPSPGAVVPRRLMSTGRPRSPLIA